MNDPQLLKLSMQLATRIGSGQNADGIAQELLQAIEGQLVQDRSADG